MVDVGSVLRWRRTEAGRAWLAAQNGVDVYVPPPPPTRFTGRDCHYCGDPDGYTRDHIVPRSIARFGKRRSSGYHNIVPCCVPCNQRKADQRADCSCRKCSAAWETFGPPGWQSLPVVHVGRVSEAP